MSRRTILWILALAGMLLLIPAATARAEEPPPTTCVDPNCDSTLPIGTCPPNCAPGGGGGSGVIPGPGDEGREPGSGSGGGGGEESCGVGTRTYSQTSYIDPDTPVCITVSFPFDSCSGTGDSSGLVTNVTPGSCSDSSTYEKKPVCDRFEFSNGRLTCHSTCFNVELRASAPFPGNCIDLRPYPISLVNWPSAARYSCASEATGSDFRDYLNFGGGSSNNPAPGDWRNVRFSLTLYPFGLAYVWLPHVPTLKLPLVSEVSSPVIFKFPYPSHPAAGGGPLAGNIPGLDEAPADMPVFVGQAAAAYGLRWSFYYEEYQRIEKTVCVRGPKGRDRLGYPIYECKTDPNLRWPNGHYETEIEFEGWVAKSQGGTIPAAAINAPASLKADLNGDGIPDALWNRNVIIRRMNDINRVDDPVWRRRWAFGGTIYWGVREAQAQIG